MNAKVTKSADILTVPLSSVYADFAWNARSTWEKGGDEVHSLAQLAQEIKDEGQQTPVDVVAKKGPKGQPYTLTAGFRRYGAIMSFEDPKATIDIRVRDDSPEDARLRNIKENTERQDLRSADLCWSIGEYLKTVKGDRPSQEILAKKFGLSQAYVSKHLAILDKVKPAIIEAWRSGLPLVGATPETPRQDLGIMKVLTVAQVDKDRQEEQYQSLLGIGTDGKPKVKDPADKAASEAKRVGAILGRLEAAEVVSLDGNFTEDLDAFVPSASGLPKSARKTVAGILALAHQEAKSKKPEKGEGESDDE